MVAANYYTPVSSVLFATDEIQSIVSDRMSIDVYLPDPDASLYWTGDLQLSMSCPTANIHNLHLGGTASLTNRFDGEYNTFYFDVPSAGLSALISNGNQCQFHVILNVTPGGTFYLDNLGFVYR